MQNSQKVKMRLREAIKVQTSHLARCGNRRAGDRPRGPAPGLAAAAVKAVKVAQSGPVQNFPKDSSEFRKTARDYCDQMIRNGAILWPVSVALARP